MTEQNPGLEAGDILMPYWVVVLARAAVMAIAAVVITFSADHSPQFGLAVFGLLAIVVGAVIFTGGRLALHKGSARTISLLQGGASIAVGVAAVAIAAGLPFLILVVVVWSFATGGLELVLAVRQWGRPEAKEWIATSIATIALGVVTLLIPADPNQAYAGGDGVERFLTASIVLVGVVGAYSAIVAVYLAIAGFSLKWASKERVETAGEAAIAEREQ